MCGWLSRVLDYLTPQRCRALYFSSRPLSEGFTVDGSARVDSLLARSSLGCPEPYRTPPCQRELGCFPWRCYYYYYCYYRRQGRDTAASDIKPGDVCQNAMRFSITTAEWAYHVDSVEDSVPYMPGLTNQPTLQKHFHSTLVWGGGKLR